MRYRLRTLVILTALSPPVLAAVLMAWGGGPFNSAVVAIAAYVGLVVTLILVSMFAENKESHNPHFEAQVETFDRQTKETDRLLAEQEQSMRRSEELRAKQEANAESMEKLIHKMEEQTRRKDAILDAEERQLGMKASLSRER